MAFVIKTDQVLKDTESGIYTVYYYVVDESFPSVRLAHTSVQGATQEEIRAQLQAKYEKFMAGNTNVQKANLLALADAIAQDVMTAVSGE